MTYLRTARIQNFKAIRDTGNLNFGNLTVFIGNNGVGKSSVIEALEAYQHVVLDGLDDALGRFNSLEHVRNKNVASRNKKQGIAAPESTQGAIRIGFVAQVPEAGMTHVGMALNVRGSRLQYIQAEVVRFRGESVSRDLKGAARSHGEGRSIVSPLGKLRPLYSSLRRWQFISLEPDLMGQARARLRSTTILDRSGANLASFLLNLSERAPDAFHGLVEAMQFVLPYAKDIRPTLQSSAIDERVFLELAERDFRVPSWLMSSGTLRLLAILALLRDPEPPPVIFIEEIENGLDPRTIGMLVEEIRMAVTSGHTQVIATTHSPYLLDQLTFEHVIVVERNEAGAPEFWRPEDEDSLKVWSKDFSPGQIYAMGQMHREPGREKGMVKRKKTQ